MANGALTFHARGDPKQHDADTNGTARHGRARHGTWHGIARHYCAASKGLYCTAPRRNTGRRYDV
eukprot:8246875-Pyramimonas_sp.AAC.1